MAHNSQEFQKKKIGDESGVVKVGEEYNGRRGK
jgi:hypothetical protein